MILQIIFLFLLIVLLTAVLHIFLLPVHIGLKGGYPVKSGIVFDLRWGIGMISGEVKDDLLTVRLYGLKVFRRPLSDLKDKNSKEKAKKDSGKAEDTKDLPAEDKTDYLKIICFIRDNLLTGEFGSLLRQIDFERFHTDITVGLDDPVATGKIYGYLMAVSGYLYSHRYLSLNVYSRFDRPAFEIYCDGRIRVCRIYRIMIFAVKMYRRLKAAGLIGKRDDSRDTSSGNKDDISKVKGAESSLTGHNNPV
ncbi:DUF2953 domain-containing protein [Methanoplanus endosymbiosus]|uniref:DUF2953 domain-containing protein n=1 Tax=Methanoplanus endosymbiosus TaxID=33865 RepID=A0A9E7PP31_9EURY|nr:DUF2953 domain-containing protein [Methanoplanus endosymbiosus]UUX93788.1 DUF2953 domain-containing protein [Methanoplanus endosymbiosus]